jgi:hypothetical protein
MAIAGVAHKEGHVLELSDGCVLIGGWNIGLVLLEGIGIIGDFLAVVATVVVAVGIAGVGSVEPLLEIGK